MDNLFQNSFVDMVKPLNHCPYAIVEDLVINESQKNCFFQVLHLNIRSLPKKSDYLKMLLEDLCQNHVVFDAILLCETYLTSNSAQLVNLPGYQLFYKARENRPGGGVVIFVKNCYDVSVLDTPFNDTTESLFIECKLGRDKICLGELYRIPNTNLNEFKSDYTQIFYKLLKYKKAVIGCDHNLDLIKSNHHLPNMQFLEDMTDNSFVLTILRPTHMRPAL